MNILIFNFLYLLHVSNPKVHLQEYGCIYSCGMVRCTCISISNLVGRAVFDINVGNVHIVGLHCLFTDLVLY
jgi:hypothetical protein